MAISVGLGRKGEILRGVYPERRFFDRLRMSGKKGSQ
jgi:hypothetical protein